MLRFSNLLAVGLTLGIVLSLTGCKADNKPAQSTLVSTPQAVVCNKCQMTWVKVPEKNGKSRVVAYSSDKRWECRGCEDVAKNLFVTGKLQHACKACGDAMEIGDAH